jgi:MerR family transcriptional regulator, light-induced transcriptional regulator
MPAAPRGKTRARTAAEPAQLSIGALSRAAGIPVPTLRTWERRYDFPAPLRKPSGHRLYPTSAVEHLRKVSRLLEQGHRAAEVLALPSDELDALLALGAPDAPQSPAARPARFAPADGLPPLEDMLAALRAFDRESLLAQLRADWARLGPQAFLRETAGPLMVEVGRAWHARTLEIRHEHFATACLGGFLREVREPFDQRARGRRVVAATLPGDAHEGGLLMASLVMAMRGRRVVYLGTDMPVAQLADSAAEPDVEAVALSISSSAPRARTGRALAALRAALPRRVAVWFGGAGAPEAVKGCEHFANLEALDARLARGG